MCRDIDFLAPVILINCYKCFCHGIFCKQTVGKYFRLSIAKCNMRHPGRGMMQFMTFIEPFVAIRSVIFPEISVVISCLGRHNCNDIYLQ